MFFFFFVKDNRISRVIRNAVLVIAVPARLVPLAAKTQPVVLAMLNAMICPDRCEQMHNGDKGSSWQNRHTC